MPNTHGLKENMSIMVGVINDTKMESNGISPGEKHIRLSPLRLSSFMCIMYGSC